MQNASFDAGGICKDWDTFYDQYGEWSDGEILTNLASLENIGPAVDVSDRMHDYSDKPQFSVGQRVRVKRTGKEGTFIAVSDSKPRYYTVSLGRFGETATYRGHELKRTI